MNAHLSVQMCCGAKTIYIYIHIHIYTQRCKQVNISIQVRCNSVVQVSVILVSLGAQEFSSLMA